MVLILPITDSWVMCITQISNKNKDKFLISKLLVKSFSEGEEEERREIFPKDYWVVVVKRSRALLIHSSHAQGQRFKSGHCSSFLGGNFWKRTILRGRNCQIPRRITNLHFRNFDQSWTPRWVGMCALTFRGRGEPYLSLHALLPVSMSVYACAG